MLRFSAILVFFILVFFAGIFSFAGEIDEGFRDLNLQEQWSGDFDGMAKRKVIRVLVVHNKMLYFIDKGNSYFLINYLG